MSHFYAEMQGNRGRATRCGTKQGMQAHIRGWHKGIVVKCYYDATLDKDVFEIWESGGSNDAGNQNFIAEVRS